MKLKNLFINSVLLFSIALCFLLAYLVFMETNAGEFLAENALHMKVDQLILLFLIVFIIIVALLLRVVIINRFSKPVAKIVETIHRVDKGDLDIRFEYDDYDEFCEIADAFNNLMDTIANNTNEIEKGRRELQSLTDNIPGGVYKCKDDIVYTLYYISDGFIDVVGCSKDEVFDEYQGKIMNFIHPDDRELVIKHMNIQLARENTYELQYRMIRKDKSIRWILDKGTCVQNEETGEFELNGVIIDITALTEAMKQRKKNDENYRIIGEQFRDVIFEWDFSQDIISYTHNWYEKFSYEPIKENASEALLKSENIHHDDKFAFAQWVNKIFKGNSNTTIEIRLKTNCDEYLWVRIRTTAITDEQGVPIKAVGAITDIHHQKQKEEQLLKKAEFDILTKIFNRGAFEERALAWLEKAKKEQLQLSFLFIDIDDFRYYNSEFGHSFGDKIIVFIGQQIKKMIDGIGFAGRCGGDEFIICIHDQRVANHISRIAKEIIRQLKNGFYDNEYNKKIEVNCSIGVVKYPGFANTYDKLVIAADEAMYKAKQAGKGRFYIYNTKQ